MLVERTQLDNDMRRFENDRDPAINQFVNCLDLEELGIYKTDLEELIKNRLRCFEELHEDDYDFIQNVIEFANGHFFFSYLMKENAFKCKRPLTVPELVEQVLKKSYTDCTHLSQSIENGRLAFARFDQLIRIQSHSFNHKADKINPQWSENVKLLMTRANIDPNLQDRRLNQFDVYLKLTSIVKITHVLLDIKEKSKFTGNFKFLEATAGLLHTNVYANKLVRDLNGKSIKMYKKLEAFGDEAFVHCLEQYSANYGFVEWLRTNAPSLNALKLLGEFASEAENENEGALEVVKVQSLQLVGTAYSPLIYNLPVTSSFDDLVKCLEQVHFNLKKNPKLPKKLVNISSHKTHLKDK